MTLSILKRRQSVELRLGRADALERLAEVNAIDMDSVFCRTLKQRRLWTDPTDQDSLISTRDGPVVH